MLKQFNTPAYQGDLDFKNQSQNQSNPALEQFKKDWHNYVLAVTENSQLGNPWGAIYDSPRANYYSPINNKDYQPKGNTAPIQWFAFPNRLKHYFSNIFREKFGSEAEDKMYELADIGPIAFVDKYEIPGGISLSDIRNFGPAGPRGWQDEYCEWTVKRNEQGQIIEVSFTHENPEYWSQLWRSNPDLVVELYQQILGHSNVKKEDLYLLDEQGQPVIVRQTGQPAYNPINKWNKGSNKEANSGGAIHLTSPPNSLGAEIYLGAAATILRKDKEGNIITGANELIRASRYGQIYRSSDPHIGASVNGFVQRGFTLTLTDPIGLYGSRPDFNAFTFPEGYSAEDFYEVIRGKTAADGEEYDMILHARFKVPADCPYTISDIEIDGKKVKWGSQIAEKIHVQLAGTVIEPEKLPQPNPFPAVDDKDPSLPSVYSILDYNILKASLYNKLSSLSTITSVVTKIPRGATVYGIAIIGSGLKDVTNIDLGTGIHVEIIKFVRVEKNNGRWIEYLVVNIQVDDDVKIGMKSLRLYNSEQTDIFPLVGALEIVENTPTLALEEPLERSAVEEDYELPEEYLLELKAFAVNKYGQY